MPKKGGWKPQKRWPDGKGPSKEVREKLSITDPRYRGEDVQRQFGGKTPGISTWYFTFDESVDAVAGFRAKVIEMTPGQKFDFPIEVFNLKTGDALPDGLYVWVLYGGELLMADRNRMRMRIGDNEVHTALDTDWAIELAQTGVRLSFTHHSTPAAGRPVDGAGMMTIGNCGEITSIDDKSGHYAPSAGEFGRSIAALYKMGLDPNLTVTVKGLGDPDRNVQDAWHAALRKRFESTKFEYPIGPKGIEMPASVVARLAEDLDPYTAGLKKRTIVEIQESVPRLEAADSDSDSDSDGSEDYESDFDEDAPTQVSTNRTVVKSYAPPQPTWGKQISEYLSSIHPVPIFPEPGSTDLTGWSPQPASLRNLLWMLSLLSDAEASNPRLNLTLVHGAGQVTEPLSAHIRYSGDWPYIEVEVTPELLSRAAPQVAASLPSIADAVANIKQYYENSDLAKRRALFYLEGEPDCPIGDMDIEIDTEKLSSNDVNAFRRPASKDSYPGWWIKINLRVVGKDSWVSLENKVLLCADAGGSWLQLSLDAKNAINAQSAQ